MKEKAASRSRLLQVRLTPQEYERISANYAKTTCRQLSDYVRKILIEKPVTVNQRNQSLDDFMTVMIGLRKELNAVGNNFNQMVRRLHMLRDFEETIQWLRASETTQKVLLQMIQDIKMKIEQLNDQWLR